MCAGLTWLLDDRKKLDKVMLRWTRSARGVIEKGGWRRAIKARTSKYAHRHILLPVPLPVFTTPSFTVRPMASSLPAPATGPFSLLHTAPLCPPLSAQAAPLNTVPPLIALPCLSTPRIIPSPSLSLPLSQHPHAMPLPIPLTTPIPRSLTPAPSCLCVLGPLLFLQALETFSPGPA